MGNTLKFKTNINCNGCISNVTPFLNETEGIFHWDVDILDERKILTVNIERIIAEDIIKKIEEAGYEAVEIAP